MRLYKEFNLCTKDVDLPQIVCNFKLVDNNIYNWEVTIFGLRNSPYEGGLFIIDIIFPPNYPNRGPEFKFRNKIYKNVDWRSTSPSLGHISLSSLNEWYSTGKVRSKRGYNVKNALFDIFCLFYLQGIDSPYDDKMAALYIDDRLKFYEEAKRWTKLYAS